MLNNRFSYRRIGEKSIEIFWGQEFKDILKERHRIALILQGHYGKKALINEGYLSILIIFNHGIKNLELRIKEINNIISEQNESYNHPFKHWNIPILYDQDSPDLLSISKHTLLTFESIKLKHENALYTVEFIGFLPGFPYLSGLPEILHIPRRQIPNARMEPGTVAIAAGQCGIYPSVSPGGWYALGKSPFSFFDVNQDQPNLLSIGDRVSFYSISSQEYENLKLEHQIKRFSHDG